MSPDIEWRIEDDGGQHTVSSPPPRLARPRRWAFAAIIVTGMVCFYLGVYVAQPGQPAPTPAPIVITRLFTQPAAITPESLAEAISRDAAALDPRSLIMTSTAHLDAVYAAWYRSLLQIYGPIEPAYTIVQSGTLPNGSIWLDLSQAVAEGAFRSTRFYRQQDNRWTWTLPDPSFWSGAEETLVFDQDWWGMPLKVNYPVEDRALIGETVARIQQVHAQLCAEMFYSSSPTSARDQWPDLDTQSLAPLADVWHWPHAEPPDDRTLRIMRAEAYAAIVFIDLRFGREAVGKFLRALGSAASLEQAIEMSTGLTSAEFEERWLKWLGKS